MSNANNLFLDRLLRRGTVTTQELERVGAIILEKMEGYEGTIICLTARVKELEGGRVPTEPGGFVGDIFYGNPVCTTIGTHKWNGFGWLPLPSVEDALTELLAQSRARVAELEAALQAIDIGFVRAKDAPAMHDEAIRIARAALSASQPAPSPWQPIKSAPKDGTVILIRESGSNYAVSAFWRRDDARFWTVPTSRGWMEAQWMHPVWWMPFSPAQQKEGERFDQKEEQQRMWDIAAEVSRDGE